jgi:DNA-binding LacI/PurR family transcriptional regulator
MPQVTLNTVATRAGVHRSTVSLALRNHPRIPEETRHRIQSIAASLGYRPNPLVAALMQLKRSARPVPLRANLAYLTAFPTRDGWRENPPDFFPGAEARARELGYRIAPFWLREPRMTPRRMAAILKARGTHGIVVSRPPPGTPAIDFPWGEFASVSLGVSLEEPNTHRVSHHHFYDAVVSLDHARALGYRRVGFAFLHLKYARAQQRWIGGALARLREIPPEDRVEPLVLHDYQEGRLTDWVRRERVDAVITGEMVPSLAELSAARIRIPQDIGYAALNLFQHDPRYAGVYHNPAHTGAAAVNLLVSQLYQNERGLPAVPTEVLLNGQWQDGASLPPVSGGGGDAGSIRRR